MNKFLAIVAILAGLGGWHYWDRQAAVHNAEIAVTARLNKSWQDQWDSAKKKSDKAREELISSHSAEVESKNAKIKTINRKLSDALISLQHRPTRTEYDSNPPSTGSTCTGKELTREDAEFLTGEAAESDKRAVERDYYYNEYEKTRIILDKLRNNNGN